MRCIPLVVLTVALAARGYAEIGPIAYGQVVMGSLGASEQDVYTFTAPANARVMARVARTSGEQSVSVNLHRVGVGSVGLAAGIGPVSEIVGAAVLAGQSYEVQVGADPTGPAYAGQTYRLLLQNLTEPAGATAVGIGGSGTGSIDHVGDARFYTITAHAGDTLLWTVTRTSGAVDPEAVQFIPQFANTCTPNFDGQPDHPTILTQCNNFATDGAFTFWIDDYDDDTPEQNGGTDTGGYSFTVTCFDGPCLSDPTTTTTTTILGATTTTSTLVPVPGLPIDGKKLLVKTPANPAKRLLTASSADVDITLGGGNGSADDPRTAGGTLRVRSVAAAFDATYALPAARWKTVGASGANKGYKYGDPGSAAGPVSSVVVKRKQLMLTAKGTALAVALGANPDPVELVFTMGGYQACAQFGGTTTFVAGKKFAAKLAPAPSACP